MPNNNIVRRGGAGWRPAAAMLLAVALLSACEDAKRADVSKMDIEGFRLGMTLQEVKEKWPDVKVQEVKDSGLTVGYEGHKDNIQLTFASDKFSNALFFIRLTRTFPQKPDSYPIYMEYVKKYGPPDYSGRQVMSMNACWGKCFGENKKLEFVMGIVAFPNKPYPMTLTLSDLSVGAANRQHIRSLLAKQGS